MSLWGDITHIAHTVEHGASGVWHGITHVWHDAWGWTKEQADRYKNDIENDLKGDLRTDATKIIDSLGSNALGREALNLVNSIHSDADKFIDWSVGKALEKEYWAIDPLEIELINSNSLASAKAPIITITPSLRVVDIEFKENMNATIGHPSFDFSQLSFVDSQKLDFKLAADLSFLIGLDIEIQTFDSGQFYSPVSLSENKSLGKDQESDGIVSFSAGLDFKGGMLIEPWGSFKTFSFSVDQPFSVNIAEDAYISLSERVNAGSIWDAAKTFMSHPFSSGSAERHEISSHNHFGASASITGDSPEKWLNLQRTQIHHPDEITGLNGFITISPEVGMQVGLILKEIGEGVDIGSLNFNIDAQNQFTFGSENEYDFSLIGDAGVTGLGISFGPAHWSAFSENLAKETWNLATINLETGSTTSDWAQPQFTSGINDDLPPHHFQSVKPTWHMFNPQHQFF
tara:strand:- start:321 stop:1694 length:1374 start_codon:yes stop_codon:yes gene_type:complete